MQSNKVKQMIEMGLPGAQVDVKSNDGTHFNVTVIYRGFSGMSTVKQHQMVYATLGDNIHNNTIHALALKTYTPQQWETQ